MCRWFVSQRTSGGRAASALATLLALTLATVPAAAAPAQAWPVLDRFANAEVQQTATDAEAKQRRLILGPLKKIKNTLAPVRQQFVRGTLRAETYFVPDERRVEPVRAFLDGRLDLAGETLYECQGRTCGSSNYWANTVFGERILYGPEQYQSYRIVRMAGVPERYLAAYVGQRGTRKIYVHVQLVIAAGNDAPTFANLLGSGAIIFDESTHQIEALRAFLNSDPSHHIAVVVHGGGALDTEVALSETRQRAERVRRRLIDEGIAAARLSAYGVGPLAPVPGKPASRTEFVSIAR